jgi:hypothetical protein
MQTLSNEVLAILGRLHGLLRRRFRSTSKQAPLLTASINSVASLDEYCQACQ